jgi:hypothetical protein
VVWPNEDEAGTLDTRELNIELEILTDAEDEARGRAEELETELEVTPAAEDLIDGYAKV